ncbi:anti-sigma F factor [Sedimentibacter saalensis]|jgi:stage II sporulation protein AB (anti-sigma F factor)|uniref:Stage II sporulation protein AB (Anti-sigma F factor) n=1 Tax=Sedimentibacter saalensis TaxID=130788 RepID=A0A562JHW8_9FIRM|nr:anti-sigma F factor [Sedimentibacter saalensis]MEA5094573.1 anti-sigma F factor [Sedimentibacter saalensis]TWH82751.1 stage II sporulation protein AB (anti-sigma F factor) [Sedimentibacter saalensis]
MQNNYVFIKIPSFSTNESFARAAVAAFCSSLNPTIEEISDIKTAVSEAVTNAIIHGYEDEVGDIEIQCRIKGQMVEIIIEDFGCGIVNVEKAKEPLYTTKPELERSGMGFAVMETFMDELIVLSEKDVGTKVIMRKTINSRK